MRNGKRKQREGRSRNGNMRVAEMGTLTNGMETNVVIIKE